MVASPQVIILAVLCRLDYWMSAYPSVKPLGLLFLTLFLIGVGGLALYAVSEEPFYAEAWNAWSYLADAGIHSSYEAASHLFACLPLGNCSLPRLHLLPC